jgi:peroxiredoxin
VAAVSADPPEISRRQRASQGYTFPILADVDRQVIRRYDLLHAGAGPEGVDVARPAEFLIDAKGIVRWANLTESYTERVTPEEILRAAEKAGLK